MVEDTKTPAPSAAASSSTTAAIAPTTGAVIGTALGAYVASLAGPADPLVGHLIQTAVTGLVTALFHFVGSKIAALKL